MSIRRVLQSVRKVICSWPGAESDEMCDAVHEARGARAEIRLRAQRRQKDAQRTAREQSRVRLNIMARPDPYDVLREARRAREARGD